MAVNKYQAGGGNVWGSTASWSLGTIPTASDGHVATFDATSPNCNVDSSSRVCNAIDFTGYTNAITMSNQITVSGNITLSSSMVIAGTGKMLSTGSASTITANGKVWPNAFDFGANGLTQNVADAWVVNGLVQVVGTTGTLTLNGGSIECKAGLTQAMTSGIIAGTTTFSMTGTGTFTPASTSGQWRSPLTFNTAGTITIANGSTFRFNTATFTCSTPANVVTTNVAFNCAPNGASTTTTLDMGGLSFTSVTFGVAATHTLSSTINCTGVASLGNNSSGTTVINGGTINTSGGLLINLTSGQVSGTTQIILSGTGSIASNSNVSQRFFLPIEIAAGAGTITCTNTPSSVDFSVIKFTSGTVITNAGTWTASGGGGITQFSSTF